MDQIFEMSRECADRITRMLITGTDRDNKIVLITSLPATRVLFHEILTKFLAYLERRAFHNFSSSFLLKILYHTEYIGYRRMDDGLHGGEL